MRWFLETRVQGAVVRGQGMVCMKMSIVPATRKLIAGLFPVVPLGLVP
jgi:hypothetical protein